jgi:ParB family chromosome partitioning protein
MNAEKKTRLGRGLDALLNGGEIPAPVGNQTRQDLSVTAIDINPFQPRKQFDDDEINSLGDSIRQHGVLQPLLVRQVGERFQLIAGERRLRAAQMIGLTTVPVTVVNFNDQQSFEAALVENMQRTDLNPIEKAQGFKDYLTRYEMTHEQLASRLGVSRSTITNLVSLLDLPANLQESVRTGELSVGHAKILKGITDEARQQAIAREIISRGLSVHATEALVKQPGNEEKPEGNSGAGKTPLPEKTSHVASIEDELRQKLGVKLEIRIKSQNKGQFILSFDSNDDFERLVEILRR